MPEDDCRSREVDAKLEGATQRPTVTAQRLEGPLSCTQRLKK